MKKGTGLASTVVRPSLLGLLVVVLAMLLVVRTELLQALKLNWSYVVLAALLGAISGASELISRYRDEPVHAATSLAGVFYIALNALVSACAHGLLTQYSKAILPSLADDALMRSLVAGFGAMALLRSKLHTVRTEQGEDVPIGPDIVVSAFLSAADRSVDRTRASRRLRLVFEGTASITRPELGADFLRVSLAGCAGPFRPELSREIHSTLRSS